MLVKECARDANAVLLGSDGDFFQKTDAQFWMDVLEENKGTAQPKLSACIYRFCSSHEGELTSEIFQQLTDESLLPEVCFESSCGLMKLEKSVVPDSTDSAPSNNGSEELTSLQQRCVKAIVSKWSVLYHDSMEESLLEIGLHVYRKVMRDIVSLAKSDVEEFNSLKEKLPRFIVVTCPGDHTFKGCYIRQDELHDGAPKYSMKVEQSDAYGNERTETWEISFCENIQLWFLSKLGYGDDPEDGVVFYFYNDETSYDLYWILPPRDGWQGQGRNLQQVLKLRYKYEYELPDAEVLD